MASAFRGRYNRYYRCNRRIKGVEDIILSVQDNALGVTKGIGEMKGIDAFVGRAGRCYH